MNYFRRFRDAAVCVALLAIPFFFLSANLRHPENTNVVDRMVLQASAPVQYVASQVAQSVSGIVEEYVYLVDVKRENERLRAENARLSEENQELRIQARENERFRQLLSLRERLGGDTLSAQVIARETSPYFRVIRVRLDRGERDDVRVGMPVVSAEGLVGQVRRTWGRYSDVLLTVDPTSAIDVVIQRGGARGILRGTGENDRYLCRVEYLQRTDEVKAGDEVYTSGLGRRFPASILVGRIREVGRRESGLYQEAYVQPAVSFSTLEEVLILTSSSRQDAVAEGEWDEGEERERPAPDGEEEEP